MCSEALPREVSSTARLGARCEFKLATLVLVLTTTGYRREPRQTDITADNSSTALGHGRLCPVRESNRREASDSAP